MAANDPPYLNETGLNETGLNDTGTHAARSNNTGSHDASSRRACGPAMTPGQADLLRECLDLAIDRLDAGVGDASALRDLVSHLKPALRLARTCQGKVVA